MKDKLQENTDLDFKTQGMLVQNELIRFANKCRKRQSEEHRKTLVLCSPHLKCYIAMVAAPPWNIPMKEFIRRFQDKVLKDDRRLKSKDFQEYTVVLVAIRYRNKEHEMESLVIPSPSNNKKDLHN